MASGRSSKSKGYRGETEFVQAAAEHGYEAGRNGNVYGNKDRGDIHGIPGWVIQVKSVATPKIPEFIKDAGEQAKNAGVRLYCVALKLRGKHMRDGVILMPVRQWFEIVKEMEELRSDKEALTRLLHPEA
ncbi:MAG: hypothetical protein HOY79_28805 [Streptomyces sp.]|nr:hypothetical protein [Streptomyces sp.]